MLTTKKILSLIIFILTFWVGKVVYTEDEIPLLKNFYLHFLHGEKSFDLYDGPISPEFIWDRSYGLPIFKDEIYYQNFFNNRINEDLFEIFNFVSSEVTVSMSCPNQVMGKHIDYIRYLYRLVVISYLYEGMKLYNRDMYRLGLNESLCPVSWDEVFSNCHPKSNDMKTFLTRAKVELERNSVDWSAFESLSQSSVDRWNERFQSLNLSDSNLSITERRLLHTCKDENLDCQKEVDKESLQNVFKASCQKDLKLMSNLCSENDDFYGHSKNPFLFDVLASSHALGVINQEGYGEGCLFRFQDYFSSREIRLEVLTDLLPELHGYVQASDSRHVQGSLFIPGSLREFDERGLDLALYIPSEEEVEEEVIKEIEPPPVIAKVEKEPEPEPVEIIVETPIVVEEVEEEEDSYFYQMVERMIRENMESLALDMGQFKKDFIFTEELTQVLSERLRSYQTRDALLDMKTFDGLGGYDEPIRLIFLKFLIDSNQHQGVFNIVDIIGDNFWIKNDIDQSDRPVKISLLNDASTNYQWKITLLNQEE